MAFKKTGTDGIVSSAPTTMRVLRSNSNSQSKSDERRGRMICSEPHCEKPVDEGSVNITLTGDNQKGNPSWAALKVLESPVSPKERGPDE